MPVLERQVSKVESLLEVGGVFPGLAHWLCNRYHPRWAAVVNLKVEFPEAFKTPEREIDLIRADVLNLPFRSRCCDLVASAFMLEHVRNWKRALGETLRVGDQVFHAFGPNRWFPFEMGHLDAPLAGTLPKSVAAYVAWLWLKVMRRRRSMGWILDVLSNVTHISSREFRAYCLSLGAQPRNMFPDLIEVVSSDEYSPPSFARRIARSFPSTTRWIAKLLSATGLEPQMYYFIKSTFSER